MAELVEVQLPRPRLGVENVERREDQLFGFPNRGGIRTNKQREDAGTSCMVFQVEEAYMRMYNARMRGSAVRFYWGAIHAYYMHTV